MRPKLNVTVGGTGKQKKRGNVIQINAHQCMTEAVFSHLAEAKGRRLKNILLFGEILKLNVEIVIHLQF